jgi:hypothetical protein
MQLNFFVATFYTQKEYLLVKYLCTHVIVLVVRSKVSG